MMRLAEAVRSGWVLGIATLAVGATLAARAVTPAAPARITVDGAPEVPAVGVRDSVGDPPCASDVTTIGNTVLVHLVEDSSTCTGVVRIYRVEGDQRVFVGELDDLRAR